MVEKLVSEQGLVVCLLPQSQDSLTLVEQTVSGQSPSWQGARQGWPQGRGTVQGWTHSLPV